MGGLTAALLLLVLTIILLPVACLVRKKKCECTTCVIKGLCSRATDYIVYYRPACNWEIEET